MSDNIIPLNIVIADRTYRIKANAADEESIRKTVKFLNDKLLEFKTQFAGKDIQDYLAMAVIWYATQNAENKQEVALPDENEVIGKIEAINKMLDGI